MAKHINQAQIEQFAQDGVIVLHNALSSLDVEKCFAAWQWSLQHPSPLASGLLPGAEGAFQDLCNPRALEAYEDVVQKLPLADYAQELWQSDQVWFLYEQVFHKTGGNVGRTPWHQDTSYLALGGSHLIAFWISFESIPASACLEFVRGSHAGPLYNTSRFDPNDETLPIVASPSLQNLPAIESDRASWDIVSYDVEPGDVIAFHTSTLHGGGPVNEKTRERRTLTLRFFGEDTQCEARPGQAGPFYPDIKHLQPGDLFRHPRFLKVR